MYCISKNLLRTLAGFAAALILVSCSDGGVQSGSSTSKFSGVQQAIVISPTSIKLTWTKNSSAKEYQILENSSATPIGTTALDYYIIENLTPETSYTFKVIGTSETSISGADKELKATTWPRFTGIGSATADALGSIDLVWPYDYSPQKFLIFYRKGSPPDATSTNNWTSSSLETTKKNISISDLDGSSTYYFMVHAQYSDKEKEIATKTLSLTTKTTFATPNYSISDVSIGNVPILTIDPIPDTLHGINFYKTTVLWKGNAVSDPLTGKGQLVLHANAGLPLGKVQNLSLKVDYADGNRTESLTIEGLETYIKGMPTNIETPAISSLALGASYLGKVLSKGDFNCDGLDDLAVGLPDVSVADLGVKVNLAGAVIVYYSKEVSPGVLALNTTGIPKTNPAIGDPQIITFDDLTPREQFGFSLAAGNFNGDKNGLANCDDLLVGAPYATSTFVSKSSPVETYNYQNGAAYLFFGSSKGLSSSSHISDIASNTSTCDGSLNNAICSPVKLYENQFSIPKTLTSNDQLVKSNTTGVVWDHFGSAVTFAGDFNADGFDDIAIGAPHANYDGKVSHLSASGSGYLEDVGAVYIFFGSKYGLGFEYPAANGVPNPAIDAKVRFLKVYAPIPQKGALFGASLAGGADIDGRYKIKSGSNHYGGGDLVVGSPGFKYENYTVTNYLAKAPDYTIGTDPNINSVLQALPGNDWWDVNGVSLNSGTNYYGFEQSSSKAVGAAFIYFGRNAGTTAPAVDESPTRAAFWKCGKRGMAQEQHYSCLFDNSNVKMLTPRKSAAYTTIENFGAAVAVIGSKSRYKENSTDLLTLAPPITEQKQYYSDTNEDGYADVVVSAPKSTVSGKSNVGVLHVFYGNLDRLFNPHDMFDLYSGFVASSDSGNNEVTCTGFIDTAPATKKLCRPVVLSSASLATGSYIGQTQAQFAVGDVTGDGLLDLAVGAAGDNVIGAGSGAALVYTSVKNGGLSSTYKKIYTVSAGTSDNLGRSVVIGNFNGDKNTDDIAKGNAAGNPLAEFPYGDLFAGAPNDTVTRAGGGAVYGFYTQNTSLASILSSHSVLVSESIASFSEYGLGETRLVGDINNDGYADAISKLTSYGQSGGKTSDPVIYYGSSIGLITTSFCKVNKDKIFTNGSGAADADCYPAVNPSQSITLNDIALPQKILKPSNVANLWSFMGVDAGDVNNDGFSDVLFIPAKDSSPGYSTLYFGSRTGLLNVVDPSWLPAQGDPQIVSEILISQYGNGLDTYSASATNNRSPYIAADFNRDGYSDLVFGLPSAASRSMNIGPGSPDPVDIGGAAAPPSGWVCGGSDSPECLGGNAAWYTGSIRILYGSSTGYQTPRKFGSIDDIDRGDAPPTMNMVGTEQASAAGKPCESSDLLNGGKLDPLCKPTYMDNPVFENINFGFEKLSHLFGQSIAAVDVNHDNYPDLLVSAPGFEDLSCYATNPKSNYGRIYVFYGSEYGLTARDARDYYNASLTGSCPASFADDNALKNINGGKIRAIMPKILDYGVAENNSNRQFGFSIATAGDVNLDGYEDFIASSPYEGLVGGSQVGTSYIYYGPLCPADNEDSIGDDFQQAAHLNIQYYFKNQLPIGADSSQESNVPLADTSLTSSCFRGASSKMKPMPQKFYVKSAEAGHQWGLSMVTGKPGKGDFNRDGYDDVIIGSPNYDDLVRGATDIGQGVIFFGSEFGLYTDNYPASSVVVTSSGQLRPYAITPVGYTNGSKFFIKMSSSGDINGDGTMDILVPSLNYSGVAPYSGIDLGTFLIFN